MNATCARIMDRTNGFFLPKPGKTDYNKPNSYRTITLSPTLLKLQEKVILWHMQHGLGMEDSLSKKQFGFKKGTSTETVLHKVIHKIEKRIAKKGYVLGHNQKMHWHSLPMQKSHRPHIGPLTKDMPLYIHSNNHTHSSLLFFRVDQSCGEQNQHLTTGKSQRNGSQIYGWRHALDTVHSS